MADTKKNHAFSVKCTKLRVLLNHGGRFVNYRIAIYGAIFLGTMVFSINFIATEKLLPSLTAALKQGSYTFVFGGVIMKLCEILAVRIRSRILSLGSAILLPSVLAITLTFGVHSLRGTPKPLASTLPTLLIIPAAAVIAIRKRKELNFRGQN